MERRKKEAMLLELKSLEAGIFSDKVGKQLPGRKRETSGTVQKPRAKVNTSRAWSLSERKRDRGNRYAFSSPCLSIFSSKSNFLWRGLPAR